MNLKQRIAGAVKFLIGGNSQSFFSSIISGRALRRNSAERDPYGSFAGWTYFAINKIAERVSMIDFRLYEMKRNGDLDEVDDHELLALLYRANPLMTKSDLVYLLAVFMKLWGAAPLYLERKGTKIVNLWPMRPDLLRMRQDDGGNVVGYEYWVGGRKITFTPEEILYIHKPDPQNPILGYSPLKAISLEIDTDMAAAVWNKYFFENNAEPGGVLETENVLKDETFNRLKMQWEGRHSGPSNAGKLAILEAGLKWKATERSGNDAGYVETRTFHRDAILTMLGVPEAMFSKDAIYANAEAAERVFSKETIEPMMMMLVDQMNEFMVPFFGEDLWLHFESPVAEDRAKKLEEAKSGINSWLTVNEVREMYNKPPLDGGDVLYMPFSSIPTVGDVPESEEEPVVPEKAIRVKMIAKKDSGFETAKLKDIRRKLLARNHLKNKMRADIAEKIVSKMIGRISIKKGSKNIIRIKGLTLKKKSRETIEPSEALVVERKAYVASLAKREKAYKTSLKKLFNEQEKAVLKKLESEGLPKGQKAFKDWFARVATVLSVDKLVKLFRNEYDQDIRSGAASVASLLGTELTDISGSKEVAAFLKRMPDKFAKEVSDSTLEMLRTELSAGVAGSESITQLSDRVAKVFDDSRSYRTERIARTEVGRGQNFGRFGEMKALGVKKRVWMSIFANTRDSHAAAHGQTVAIDESFEVGGEECEYPQDSSLSPEESINCQCSVSPVID